MTIPNSCTKEAITVLVLLKQILLVKLSKYGRRVSSVPAPPTSACRRNRRGIIRPPDILTTRTTHAHCYCDDPYHTHTESAMRILRAPRALALAACLLLAVNCFTLYLLLCNEQRQAGSKGERKGAREGWREGEDVFQLFISFAVEVQYLEMQVRTQKLLISTLQRNISLLLYQEKQRAPLTNTNAIDANVIDPNTLHLPTIYMITPTYSRWTQKADLTRLCHTLMHVPKLHWILVEDSNEKTRLVSRFLAKCKVRSTHLNTRTAEERRLDDGEPRWRKNRGVEQRNLALDWLRSEAAAGRLPRTEQSVVYFGDDDNTYDIELFEEVGRILIITPHWKVL